MELSEILKELAAYVGDDKAKAKEVREAMRASDGGSKLVAQSLIDVGQGGKAAELQGKITKLEGELATATESLAERDTEIETLKAKVPDAAKIEADLKEKHQKKLDDLKGQLKAKDETLRGALKRGSLAKLVSQLSTKHGVDPEYAQEVLAAKYGANVDVQDDGSVVVKGLDGLPIDGATEDERIAALAGEVRKGVNPRYVLTNADSGAGVRGGNGGSVMVTEEQLAAQMRATGKYRGVI